MKVQDLFEAPKGSDWKVIFTYKEGPADKDGAINSGSFVLKDYASKDRARAAAEQHLEKKYKGRQAKVTRIIEVK